MLPFLDRARSLLSNRLNLILISVLVLVLVGVFAGFKLLAESGQAPDVVSEVDLPFDAEGPYALLEPRRDGNALILNIKRVSSYEGIAYELAYQSDGIDRGVRGDVDTKDKKSEYSQEILFGTCSKGDTFSTRHCVFDKNVENGTLVLKIRKGNIVYKMETLWHFQKPDIASGEITSGDSHFVYKTDAKKEELANVGFTLVNDLTGMPKLPQGKQVLGKVYAFGLPTAKIFPNGQAMIELIDNAPDDARIFRYVDGKNEWEMLETKLDRNKLTIEAPGAGIFAVLLNSSN